MRLYGESEKSPQNRLNEKDKRRKVNYQHYTGRNWGEAKNYDLCLKSSTLGIETCADIIAEMAMGANPCGVPGDGEEVNTNAAGVSRLPAAFFTQKGEDYGELFCLHLTGLQSHR